jgi:hypothetical protein
MRSLLCIVLALVAPLSVALAQDRRLNQDLTGLPQGETMIAVNPNDPQHLVATWIDWDSPRGQRNAVFHARSLDGGATWQTAETTVPGGPGTWTRIDPAVTFDGLGNVFSIFSTPENLTDSVWVLRSTDGGLTFTGATPAGSGSADKPWIAADPVSNNVYAAWTIVGAGVRFARSTDHGVTFSTPVTLTVPSGSISMLDVGPGGEIYVVYVSQTTFAVRMDRSLDAGISWLGNDRAVVQPVVAPHPVNGGLKNIIIPDIAVDRTGGPFSGRIYVTWVDARDGDSDIYLTFSSDQADSWSTPVRVNDDIPGGGADQVQPTVWVDSAGHVHVRFLDRREDPDNLLLGVYLATSTDGGNTFGPNVRISEPDLSQGGLPGRPHTWLGDYGGGAGAGGVNHIVWSDGRSVDQDVFYRSVDDADFDEDGILNDGSADGQYANARCTGGQTVSCDDNCPGTLNPDQTDTDGDLVGDVCDNCVSTPNANQFDQDRDGVGDSCDPCPAHAGRPAGDPDGDGEPECTDNCPGLSNPGQADADVDGLGDDCDACPNDPANDEDGDGHCVASDNCPTVWNSRQVDTDGDAVGNVCDVCPGVSDPQTDTDGDGRGDACDCESLDLNDLTPVSIEHLRAFKSGATASFGWVGPGIGGPASSGMPGRGFDAFSVSRGLLSTLRSTGSFGPCFVEGAKRGFEDATLPPVGDGYVYLTQGQNFDCGLGLLGFTSGEISRANSDPLACTGHSFTDALASSETPVSGSVTGTIDDMRVSDNQYQSIREVGQGGFAHLEHRWTYSVPAGSALVEVHSEAFWIPSLDQEPIRLEYSTDGGANFTPLYEYFDTSDPNHDRAFTIPAVSGTVILRVIDTLAVQGDRDEISIDKLWIRAVP